MADISIIVGYETVKQADKAFKILDKSVKSTAISYEAAFKRLVSWQQKFESSQSRVNNTLEKNYQVQNLANKSARESANAFKRQADEVNKLAMKYTPLYAASKLYETKLEEINRAQKLGVLSDRQREASLEQLNREFNTGSGAFRTYGAGATQAARTTNQLGVVTQQVGYQVGDFAVQVQGGQSAFVAFSQQATQLVGVLPLLSGSLGISAGKLIAISAGLGIAIPLLSALVGGLFAAYKASKDAGDGLQTLGARLESARESVKSMTEDLRLMNSGFQDTTELALNDAIVAAQVKLAEALERQANAAGQSKRGARNNASGKSAAVTSAEEELALAISIRDQIKLKNEYQDAHNNAVKDMLSIQRQIRDSAWENMQAAKEDIKNQEQVNALKAVENSHTQDSAQYLALVQQYEREALEVRIKTENLTLRIAAGLRDALAVAQNFAQVDMGLSIRNATIDTNAFIAKLRLAVGIAQSLSTVKAEGKVYSGRGGNAGAGITESDRFNLGNGGINVSEEKRIQDAIEARLNPKKKSSGSSGDKDPLQTLKDQVALQQALVGKTEAQQQIINALGIDYQSKYKPSVTDALETQITLTGILTDAETKRKEAIEQAAQEQKQLVDFIGSSMENSLMGIVDGTMSVKDAFKSMAADIIKELYRVLVVQQLVNSAKSAMGGFFADGGAFSGGSQIQAYANGGIVGGPTTFPMAGGKTGLMGEAGPEAIMPLKRGANGKLGVQMEGGGGDTINVVQNFNFQANGDATIKQLIAQAAPKIAQMTKSSLLDDRRRGGSTKAAFG